MKRTLWMWAVLSTLLVAGTHEAKAAVEGCSRKFDEPRPVFGNFDAASKTTVAVFSRQITRTCDGWPDEIQTELVKLSVSFRDGTMVMLSQKTLEQYGYRLDITPKGFGLARIGPEADDAVILNAQQAIAVVVRLEKQSMAMIETEKLRLHLAGRSPSDFSFQ